MIRESHLLAEFWRVTAKKAASKGEILLSSKCRRAQQRSRIKRGKKAAGKRTAFADRFVVWKLLNALDLATGFENVKDKNTYVLTKIRRGVYNTYHVRIKYWVVAGIPYLRYYFLVVLLKNDNRTSYFGVLWTEHADLSHLFFPALRIVISRLPHMT